jgi:hypothetical protein
MTGRYFLGLIFKALRHAPESRFGRNVFQVAGFSHQTAPALYIVFVHNGRKNVPTTYRELSLAMPIEEPGSLYLSSGIDSERF